LIFSFFRHIEDIEALRFSWLAIELSFSPDTPVAASFLRHYADASQMIRDMLLSHAELRDDARYFRPPLLSPIAYAFIAVSR